MAPSPSQVTIDSGDTFRLRNDDPERTLVLVLGKKRYAIEPGKAALVPFELIRRGGATPGPVPASS